MRHNSISKLYFIIALPLVTREIYIWMAALPDFAGAPNMGLAMAIMSLISAMALVAIPYAIVDIWFKIRRLAGRSRRNQGAG